MKLDDLEQAIESLGATMERLEAALVAPGRTAPRRNYESVVGKGQMRVQSNGPSPLLQFRRGL